MTSKHGGTHPDPAIGEALIPKAERDADAAAARQQQTKYAADPRGGVAATNFGEAAAAIDAITDPIPPPVVVPPPSNADRLMHDIPNLFKHATLHCHAGRLAEWDDPTSYKENRIPVADDIIEVAGRGTVLHACGDGCVDPDIWYGAVCCRVGGKLLLAENVHLKLKLGVITEHMDGMVECVEENAVIEMPLTRDPALTEQYKDYKKRLPGFCPMGMVELFGKPSTCFARATAHIPAGATQVKLDITPNNWQVGDELGFSDTRFGGVVENEQRFLKVPTVPVVNHRERRTIQAINGNVVSLNAPLTWEHKGADPGDGSMAPGRGCPIGNYSKSIKIIGGHTMLMGDQHIEDVEFVDGGRTLSSVKPEDTTFNPDGTVKYQAPNEKGSYSIHVHKVGRNRAIIRNCTSRYTDDFGASDARWAVAFHGTQGFECSFNFFDGRIGTRHAGCGSIIATEDGTEADFLINGNLLIGSGTAASTNDHSARAQGGVNGSGVWFNGIARGKCDGNIIIDTVFPIESFGDNTVMTSPDIATLPKRPAGDWVLASCDGNECIRCLHQVSIFWTGPRYGTNHNPRYEDPLPAVTNVVVWPGGGIFGPYYELGGTLCDGAIWYAPNNSDGPFDPREKNSIIIVGRGCPEAILRNVTLINARNFGRGVIELRPSDLLRKIEIENVRIQGNVQNLNQIVNVNNEGPSQLTNRCDILLKNITYTGGKPDLKVFDVTSGASDQTQNIFLRVEDVQGVTADVFWPESADSYVFPTGAFLMVAGTALQIYDASSTAKWQAGDMVEVTYAGKVITTVATSSDKQSIARQVAQTCRDQGIDCLVADGGNYVTFFHPGYPDPTAGLPIWSLTARAIDGSGGDGQRVSVVKMTRCTGRLDHSRLVPFGETWTNVKMESAYGRRFAGKKIPVGAIPGSSPSIWNGKGGRALYLLG